MQVIERTSLTVLDEIKNEIDNALQEATSGLEFLPEDDEQYVQPRKEQKAKIEALKQIKEKIIIFDKFRDEISNQFRDASEETKKSFLHNIQELIQEGSLLDASDVLSRDEAQKIREQLTELKERATVKYTDEQKSALDIFKAVSKEVSRIMVDSKSSPVIKMEAFNRFTAAYRKLNSSKVMITSDVTSSIAEGPVCIN